MSRCAADARAVALCRRVVGQIFHDRPALEGLRARWFHARGRERMRDGIAYLWFQGLRWIKRAGVPNELDRAMVRLPGGLGFVYYVLRPLRLMRKAFTRGPGD